MNVILSDSNPVTSDDAVLFSMLQQAPVAALATLTNKGSNIIAYRFQQLAAGTWSNLDTLPSPLNNTLSPGQTMAVAVVSSYPQVRLMGSATGGATLAFGLSRLVNRPSGGVIPILNF